MFYKKISETVECVCCVRLFETPWTVALQAHLSMRILQAGILDWVAMPFSRNKPVSSASPTLVGRVFTTVPPGRNEVVQLSIFYG